MKKVICYLVTLVLVLSVSVGTVKISTEAADVPKVLTSSQIAGYFSGKSGSPGGCLAFISSGFKAMGAQESSANCAYEYMQEYMQSGSLENIPVGADLFILWTDDYIYRGLHNPTPHLYYCGNYPNNYHWCHHVGIYLGNGKFQDNGGEKNVNDFLPGVSRDAYIVGWGIHGNVELSDKLTITDNTIYKTVVAENISNTNARIKAEYDYPKRLTNCGFIIGKNADLSDGITHYETEKTYISGSGVTTPNISYDINEWHGTLSQGTTYYYQFFTERGGVTVKSNINSFTTTGQASGYLDLNGYLDGVSSNSIEGYGTADVWIYNGGQYVKVAEDCSDFYDSFVAGTKYKIDDIKAKDGKIYEGIYSGQLEGILAGNTVSVVIPQFKSRIALKNITLSKTDATIEVGDSLSLTVSYNPNNTTDSKTVKWSTSDKNVATVDTKGNVKANSPGMATITANVSGKTATCVVTVNGNSNGKGNSDSETNGDTICMLRLYNPNNGEHFYTGSTHEKNVLVSYGWQFEGTGWTGPIDGGSPVYRLYSEHYGDHHYTTDVSERDWLVTVGWTYEGVAWNSADPSVGKPLYRLYNPNAYALGQSGAHHYTMSADERDKLVKLGWIYEGIGWYGL